MSDRVRFLLDTLARPGIRSTAPNSPSRHQVISKRRADHDRVSKEELETELRLNGLANHGEQSEAARVLEVTEGCLRQWRHPNKKTSLPPRWALDELRKRREKLWPSRRLAG